MSLPTWVAVSRASLLVVPVPDTRRVIDDAIAEFRSRPAPWNANRLAALATLLRSARDERR